MKLSARNVLRGKVAEIERGSVSAIVKVDVGGQRISSSITMDALQELGIAEGSDVLLVIKASNVIVAVE